MCSSVFLGAGFIMCARQAVAFLWKKQRSLRPLDQAGTRRYSQQRITTASISVVVLELHHLRALSVETDSFQQSELGHTDSSVKQTGEWCNKAQLDVQRRLQRAIFTRTGCAKDGKLVTSLLQLAPPLVPNSCR